MKSKQLLLLIPLLLLLLNSCSVQKRAQRHLRRAIELDPTIVSKLDTKIVIDTTIIKDTVIKVEARIDTVHSNIDSILAVYKLKGRATLLENDRLKIEIQNIKGKQTIVAHNKEIRIPIRDTLRLTITKTVKATVVHERVATKGFFYFSGMLLWLGLAVAIAIYVISNISGISAFFKKIFNKT